MIGAVTTWFAVGAVGMTLGTVVFLWAGLADHRDALKYYLTLVGVSGIAAVAYGLMAVEIGWVTVDDRTVFIPRYIDWILTTPLLLLYLGLLVDASRGILAKLIGANIVMIAAGTAAALLSGVERFALFAVGAVAFVVVAYYLLGPLTERAGEHTTEPVYLSLRNLTIILWAIYPAIWLLGPTGFGLLSPLVDVLLVTYLDLVTKVGFGLIALNASALLADQLDVETELAGETAD